MPPTRRKKSISPSGKQGEKETSFGVWMVALILLIGLTLGCLELPFQIAYRMTHGKWIFSEEQDEQYAMFQKHPWLVGGPRPHAKEVWYSRVISHNSYGYRGREFSTKKAEHVKRIVTIGGSSTYGSLLSDEFTWPELLGKELGNAYEVINLGVPAYSTAEHVIQTALQLSDLAPDYAIYYVGWNDAQNIHIKDLKADYSDYHGLNQYQQLGLLPSERKSKLASVYYLRRELIQRMFPEANVKVSAEGTPDQLTDKKDPRALSIYERNLKLIITLCRAQGIRPMMIPQILNYDILNADRSYGWIPFAKDKDLRTVIGFYNETMQKVSADQKVDYISQVLQQPFPASDFLDQGHFNQVGSAKFAKAVAGYIRALPPSP